MTLAAITTFPKIAHNTSTLNMGETSSNYSRFLLIRDWSKSIGVVGRSRERVGHEVLSLVQGVGRAIFSYPLGGGSPYFIT